MPIPNSNDPEFVLARHGNPSAQYHVALDALGITDPHHINPQNIASVGPRERGVGLAFLDAASRQGYPEATEILADLNQTGVPGFLNPDASDGQQHVQELRRLASDQHARIPGQDSDQYFLNNWRGEDAVALFDQSQTVQRGSQREHDLLVRAANAGHAPSQFRIGTELMANIQSRDEWRRGFSLLRLASGEGYPEATEALEKIYRQGSPELPADPAYADSLAKKAVNDRRLIPPGETSDSALSKKWTNTHIPPAPINALPTPAPLQPATTTASSVPSTPSGGPTGAPTSAPTPAPATTPNHVVPAQPQAAGSNGAGGEVATGWKTWPVVNWFWHNHQNRVINATESQLHLGGLASGEIAPGTLTPAEQRAQNLGGPRAQNADNTAKGGWTTRRTVVASGLGLTAALGTAIWAFSGSGKKESGDARKDMIANGIEKTKAGNKFEFSEEPIEGQPIAFTIAADTGNTGLYTLTYDYTEQGTNKQMHGTLMRVPKAKLGKLIEATVDYHLESQDPMHPNRAPLSFAALNPNDPNTKAFLERFGQKLKLASIDQDSGSKYAQTDQRYRGRIDMHADPAGTVTVQPTTEQPINVAIRTPSRSPNFG